MQGYFLEFISFYGKFTVKGVDKRGFYVILKLIVCCVKYAYKRR